jgi:hypothetical protein
MPDGLGVWIVGAVLVGFALTLMSRYLHRDPEVGRTSWGFYIERTRHEEDEVWTVDPLPPPTPPPPLPPRPPDDVADEKTWPQRRED